MKPYYDEGGITIYHGDCCNLIDDLTFNVIVTDPPYGISFEGYNHGTVAGDEDDSLALWLIDSWDGPLVMFGANHYPSGLDTPGAWSCWDKRITANADRMFGSPFELIWARGDDTPGKMYRIQHGGVVNADGAGVQRKHPTQKPLTLMSRILQDWAPTGVIADPFMGSGTTLVAAHVLGRRAIGIEIEERYCEIAAKRLAQGVLDFGPAA